MRQQAGPGALQGGAGIPRRTTSGSTIASSGLFSRAFLETGAANRHSSISPRNAGVPGRPGRIDASTASRSSIFLAAARSNMLRSVRTPTSLAQSTNVRAGLAQGMRLTVPVSSSRSNAL
ncbi:MAG TPA: hypothetical protein VK889_03565 [Solirubrobacterales bacterium]|nr:hypothetical protein [Solirubrobacterales bacterium]